MLNSTVKNETPAHMRIEHLIARASNLRAPSPTVVRLLTLLNNPEADYEEVITTVARDAVLSGKLLALCNSASYGLAHPVASIEQGVHYLGYCEIHRLVMALNFGSQIGSEVPAYAMESGALWRHSLVTALLTPRVVSLSRKFGAETSIAYTAGLLHDIGKLVIGQTLDAELRDRIHHIVETDGVPMIEAERSVIGFDHAEIGAGLLRSWRIPDVIVEAVAAHHSPNVEAGVRLSAVVHVADAVAHQSGASPGRESFAMIVNEAVLTSLGLAVEELDALTLAAFDSQGKVANQERNPPAKTPDVGFAVCAF